MRIDSDKLAGLLACRHLRGVFVQSLSYGRGTSKIFSHILPFQGPYILGEKINKVVAALTLLTSC
jgi:hypothetical protein